MKLVIEYNAGDGYTYNCTMAEPVEYESPEALYSDLLDLTKKTKEDKKSYFYFLGTEFEVEYLTDGVFWVYTLEEWFEKNKINRE